MDSRTSDAKVVLPSDLGSDSWDTCLAPMAGALMAAHRELIVVCSGVRYFDDTGIALLLALAHYADRYQVRVVLDRPPDALRRRLEIAGLAWLFDLQPCYVGESATA